MSAWHDEVINRGLIVGAWEIPTGGTLVRFLDGSEVESDEARADVLRRTRGLWHPACALGPSTSKVAS